MNPFQISMPKTLEALAALDATLQIPLLKTLCDCRRIPMPYANPTPAQLIPIVQQRLAEHRRHPPRTLTVYSGDYAQWKEIHDDLEEFLTQLQTLAEDASKRSIPSIPDAAAATTETQADTQTDTAPGTPSGTDAEQIDSTLTTATPQTETQKLLEEVESFMAKHEPKPKKKSSHENKTPHRSKTASSPNNQSLVAEPCEMSEICQRVSDQLNRTTSPLEDLEPARQQKLFELLNENSYRIVQKVIAMPAPKGWGLSLSIGALQRFFARYERRQQHQQLRDSAQLAREVLANPQATDAELFAASTHLAHVRLLQTANNPNSTIRDLKDLFQIQIRLKSLDLAQQRLHSSKNRSSRGDEALTNRAPDTSDPTPPQCSMIDDQCSMSNIPTEPRTNQNLPNNTTTPSAPTPPQCSMPNDQCSIFNSPATPTRLANCAIPQPIPPLQFPTLNSRSPLCSLCPLCPLCYSGKSPSNPPPSLAAAPQMIIPLPTSDLFSVLLRKSPSNPPPSPAPAPQLTCRAHADTVCGPMLSVIENLLILQDRDRKIQRLETELNNIGPERAFLQEKAKAAQAGHEAAKKHANQIESDRKNLELEIEAKKKLIEKYSLQQFQTKKNEEYRALAHEIETCKEGIFKIEDQQLELMEKAEQAAKEVAAAAKVSGDLVKQVETQIKALGDRETSLKRQLDELRADHEKLVEAVEEGARAKYDRLRRSKGGTAIVGIEHGVCGGCHMKLPMAVVLGVQGDQDLVSCPNCGRILYYSRQMDLTSTD